jgi:hypothetical protein
VTNPNLVKEILTNKLYYKEPTSIMAKLAFFGEGLLIMNYKNWAERCKIMEHAFHLEALKVPFQTINNKVDRKNLISEKCYALKCKKINIKIVVVLI